MKYFAIIKYDIEDNNRKCSTNVFLKKIRKLLFNINLPGKQNDRSSMHKKYFKRNTPKMLMSHL